MKYGLDFGTTNSAIAIEEEGIGKVLPIDLTASDPRVIRSMLYFFPRQLKVSEKMSALRRGMNIYMPGELWYEGDFKHLVGQLAVTQYLQDSKNRKPGIKRTIMTGKYLNTGTASADQAKGDLVAERYEEVDYGTGRLVQALKTGLKASLYKGTSVFGKFFTLEELIGVFVSEIKKQADIQNLGNVAEVVCGRPVYFSGDRQKDKAAQDRLEEALKLAGFKKVAFEYEPVAAANQFIAQSGYAVQKVFVFDFGGGTLDTAIVEAGMRSKVLAADGVYIGGDLLNADILQAKLWDYFGASSTYGDTQIKMPIHIYDLLNSWYSIPNLNNPDTMELLERVKYRNTDPGSVDRLVHLIRANLGFELYEAIEDAKKKLTLEDETTIVFSDGPIDIAKNISREEFEKIINPRVEEVRQTVLRTLKTAGVTPEEIDVVVRTGGSSLIPVFESMLADIFGAQKLKMFETFTSIASGLALHP